MTLFVLISGMLYDETGEYKTSFLVGGIVTIVGALVLLPLKLPDKTKYKKNDNENKNNLENNKKCDNLGTAPESVEDYHCHL